ncbi:MAG TPA: sulfotransferase [Solirubrobacteraceae bacterium]|nr:sulfotransferase [Solirubrobacteraceae bacterium]
MSVEYGIVLGAPRSGTTFLMDVLATLPDAECVTGGLLPVGIAHLAAQPLPEDMQALLRRSLRGAIDDYLQGPAFRSQWAALRKWRLIGCPPRGLPGALRSVRRERALIYKEPFLAFAPELAYRVCGEAPVIHIFRDGRDVADSLVRSYDVLSDRKLAGLQSSEVMIGRRVGELYVPWWVHEGQQERFLAASPYVRAIWMWREMVSRCRELFADSHVSQSGRVLSVRYEDLVREPLAEGQRIVAHLRQRSTRRTRRRLRAASLGSIGVHRRRERHEIAAAEELAGEELLALGYELSGTRGA